jgi:hypothetical protein
MAKFLENPYRQLACAIIDQAVTDWRVEKYRKHYRDEVYSWFNSASFEFLANYVDLDPNVVREAIGIKECV